MSAAFAFSQEEDAKFPDECRAAILSWSDIVNTVISEEIGNGIPNPADGSVELQYSFFEITFNADGTFSGKRRIGNDPKQEA